MEVRGEARQKCAFCTNRRTRSLGLSSPSFFLSLAACQWTGSGVVFLRGGGEREGEGEVAVVLLQVKSDFTTMLCLQTHPIHIPPQRLYVAVSLWMCSLDRLGSQYSYQCFVCVWERETGGSPVKLKYPVYTAAAQSLPVFFLWRPWETPAPLLGEIAASRGRQVHTLSLSLTVHRLWKSSVIQSLDFHKIINKVIREWKKVGVGVGLQGITGDNNTEPSIGNRIGGIGLIPRHFSVCIYRTRPFQFILSQACIHISHSHLVQACTQTQGYFLPVTNIFLSPPNTLSLSVVF